MRQIDSVCYINGQWVVEFDDRSRVVVDVTGAFSAHEKTEERIRSAALRCSESNPESILSGVVVDLSGRRVN